MRKAFLVIFFAIFLSKLVFAYDISSCSVLSEEGTYYLIGNISNSSASPICINISANNVVLDCQNNYIDGIDTTGTYGIYIYPNRNITIRNCIVTDWGYGIYLSGVNNSIIINSVFNSNTYHGIYLSLSFNNSIINSTFNSNQHGIYLHYSSYNSIINSTFNSNSNNGAIFYYSPNNSIINSTFNSNINGIYLYYSSYNSIINSITNSNSDYGIYLYYSSYNSITNSISHSNSDYGIYLYSAFYNNITGGSIAFSGYEDYYLRNASSSNYFTQTNFTDSRRIYFYDTSWFNYRNESDEIWLSTNVSGGVRITRTLKEWKRVNITWIDQISATREANYNLMGLFPNTNYYVENSSGTYQIKTDSLGNLNFKTTLTSSPQVISVYTLPYCMSINQEGTYYLTGDIIDSQVDECIIINASNVVFDCQNHYIDGVNKEYSVGIFILEPNVTIMNCKIKDWYSGIITDVDFINLINNTIENSFFGIQISGGDYIRISGVFGYSLINGIYAFPRSRHGIIEKCILEGTGEGDGIRLETGLYPEDVSNWTILSCSVSGFNGGILILGENITISEISSFNNAIGIVFGGVFSVMNNSFIYNNSQFGLIYSGNEGIYSSGLIYNNFFNNTNNFIVGFAFPTNWEEPYASKFNITKTEGTNIIGKPYLGGNVWSTPEGDGFSDICDDEDGDWICDEPYTLAVRYDYYWIDYLPLKSAAIMPECERFPPEVEIIPSSQTVYRLQVAQYLLKVKNNNTPQCSPSVFYMHDILCEGSYCVVCTEKGCHPPVFPSIDTTPIEPQEVRYYPINVTPLQAGNWTFVYRVYDSSTYYYTDAYANIKALPIPCEPRNFSADWKWGWGGWFLPKNITRFRMNNCGVIVITNNDYGDTCEPRNFTVTPICPSDLECTPSGNFTIAQGEAKEIWACGKPNSVKNFTMSFRIYDPVTRYSKILSWSFSTHPCAYLDIPINYVLNSDISYNSTCFTIVSSNVVLDCNNHEVVGPFWYSGVDVLSGNVTIKNCIFKQWQTGINFVADNINMQNIMVVGFNNSVSTGIWGSGNNIKMRGIKAINCLYGIDTELTNSNISESEFINNTNGIMIRGYTRNVSVKGNYFFNNTYHIRIREGPALVYIENNKIKEGHVGIEIWRDLAFTFNNFIIGNEIDRTSVAIWLTRTYGNTIYSNTLTPWDDDVILYQVGINVWNSTKGGNYWSFANRSGYSDTCADTNQDGFCDEPYVLDEMNIDYLPLSKFVAPPPIAEARYCQICDPTGMGLLAIVCVIVNILFCFPILILILVILFAIYSFWRKYGG